MENLVTVVTKFGNFIVDRKKLGDDLKLSARVSKHLGRRPGEPTNLTETDCDPISGELFYTYATIVSRHKKRTTTN